MKNNRYVSHVYQKFEDLDIKHIEQQKNKVLEDNINYPLIHIAPEYGLLNDPNGLAFFNGEYHIFHQICPNGVEHGMKSWYHITTKDFVTYKRHGIKLKTEHEFDNYGIFSGGAVATEDNLYLLYTGNHRDANNEYIRSSYQCIAKMNKDYEIEDVNVMLEPDFNFHTEHFRDPVTAGQNKLLIGCQKPDLSGALAIVNNFDVDKNENLQLNYLENDWDLPNVYMLECPNWFTLNNQEVLVFSPQGLVAQDKYNFHNIYDVVYSVGKPSDLAQGKWSNAEYHQLDYGFDFYAPQTFVHEDEVYLIGWLGQAETIYPGETEQGWSQMLTLVRTLKLKDGYLYQQPATSYEQLRTNWITFKDRISTDCKLFELNLESNENFSLIIGNDSYQIELTRDGNEVCFDRSNMQHQVNEEYGTKRYLYVTEDYSKLQVIVDQSAIEIYINVGKYVMTSRFFIDEITFVQVKGVTKSEINFIKPIIIEEM